MESKKPSFLALRKSHPKHEENKALMEAQLTADDNGSFSAKETEINTDKMNAPTTKITNMIEEGMTVNYNSNYIAVAAPSEQIADDGSYEFGYQISFHNGMMPAFDSKFYSTVQELANAMREIADLRKWTQAEYA